MHVLPNTPSQSGCRLTSLALRDLGPVTVPITSRQHAMLPSTCE